MSYNGTSILEGICMSWHLKYTIALPENLARAHFLVYLGKTKVRINELETAVIEFRPLEHILMARHPLGCLSKGVIEFKKMQEDVTEISITLNPNPLRVFAILFPALFIILLTLFGHWVMGTPALEILKSLWTIYVSVAGGSYLIYLLIKQTVIHYFNRLAEEAKMLI